VHNHLNLPVLRRGATRCGQIAGGHHIQVAKLAEKRKVAAGPLLREDAADREHSWVSVQQLFRSSTAKA
jgi:hypothetical protein